MARKSLAEPPFIRSVQLADPREANSEEYPFCLDVVKALGKPISVDQPVTIFVGENGSGKSTLLEALAVAMGLNAEGGSRNFNFSTQRTESPLHDHLKILKGISLPRDTFFLRAESFYNVASEIERLDKEPGGGRVIDSYGGTSLHRLSHGESFLALFMNRMGGEGLYILDEPEAALSPARQITFLTRMRTLVQQRSQFVIATHSPIILAYPNARIYELDGPRLVIKKFEDTLHYQLTMKLLKHPDYLHRLVTGEDSEREGADSNPR